MATLTGTEGNDFFDDGTGTPPGGYTHNPGATTGDDFITFRGGDDIAFAGLGLDTAFLEEALPYYDIHFGADTTINVTSRFGTPDGDKELHGVEKLAFLTSTASVDVSAPRVARINSGSGADTVSMSGSVVGGVHQNWVGLDRGLFGGDTNLMTFEDFEALNLNTGGGNDNVTIGIVCGLGWTQFTDSSGNPRIAPPLTVDLGAGNDVLDLTSLEFTSFDPSTLLFSRLPPNPGRFHLLANASPVQIRMGAGDDTVMIGPAAGPVTVADDRIGSEAPGVNIVDCDGSVGNWLSFSGLGIAAGTQGCAVNLTTGLATSAIVGHQTTFSGMQNVAGTRGNDTITADERANLIDFLNGIDDGVLGGQETGRFDQVAFSTANGGLTIDLAAGTATGGTSTGLVNATFTGAEGAFGTNFADVCDGSAENDFIFGLGGNDTTDCGDGDGDIVGFTGNFAQYDIVHNADGSVTVTDLRTPAELPVGVVSDGVDTCSNVEVFRFADQLVCADAAGSADFHVNVADVVTGAMPATIVGGAGGDNTVKISLDGNVADQVVDMEIKPDSITHDILLLFAALTFPDIRVREGQHIEVGYVQPLVGNASLAVHIAGDFTETALAPNTLTLHGGADDDNFDASGVTSNHRVVMNAGGGDDSLLGGAGADVLNGETGNDDLRGGINDDSLNGGAGADAMLGGTGNDVYSVDNEDDQVTELSGEGIDTVFASIDYMLGAGLEHLRASGSVGLTLTGNTLNNSLSGGTSDDTLNGGSGNDTLEGVAGNDALNGGDGTDTATYASATAGVKVSLALAGAQNTLGAGTDTLSAIERLTGSAFADTLTGSAANNVLDGGEGNDTLNGGGGNDSLIGGGGKDTASYSGATGDVIVSLLNTGGQNTGGAGKDTLSSVEDLIGSSFNDTLTGNGGANVLNGGAGADRLTGGAGGDTLIGGTGSDLASYANAAAGLTASLAAPAGNTGDAAGDSYSSIEGLVGSRFADVLTGNSSSNSLNGGRGADQLNGGGGADFLSGGGGLDALNGGGGNDTFVFEQALASGNVATVVDFAAGSDVMSLSLAIFTAAGSAGALDAAAFHTGNGAHDADDRIIYNAANGRLFYDGDGTGAQAAKLFAVAAPGLPLTANDFVLV